MFALLAYVLGLGCGAAAVILWRKDEQPRLKNIQLALDQQALALETLKEEEEELRLVLNRVPLGYLSIDQDNYLVAWNAVACELLNCSCNVTKKRLFLEVVRSWELDALIGRTRELGVPQAQDWSLHLAAGQSRPLRATTIPLRQGGVGVFLEDRREAVSRLAQQEQWLADVAHELKTPLTAMRLVVETLQNRVEVRHQRWMERLLKETIRLTILVDELLRLSQFSTQVLAFERTDLVALLKDCWQGLEPLAGTKGLTLVYDGPTELSIEVDASYLYRAFLNLYDNAIKFSPQCGCLTLQVSCAATQVEVNLWDEGCGFPPDDLERVFQRFYRADPARSRETGGSGLGLALVREIVQAHQGEVKALNRPQGGAWIKVQLPSTRDA